MSKRHRIVTFKRNNGLVGDFTKYILQKKFFNLFWLDITNPTINKNILEKKLEKLEK